MKGVFLQSCFLFSFFHTYSQVDFQYLLPQFAFHFSIEFKFHAMSLYWIYEFEFEFNSIKSDFNSIQI
jgi:hypothetical protein